MRTVRFVKHRGTSLSVAEEQRRRRVPRSGGMTRDELKTAVEAVAAACAGVVTADAVRDQLEVTERPRSLSRVHHDLSNEARRHDTWLVRVERGYYRLADSSGAVMPAHEASGHVLLAFGRLAAQGVRTASVPQLREQLTDMGLTYSQRSAYVGLERLRGPGVPLVAKLRPGAWSLTEAGRRALASTSGGAGSAQ